MFVATSSIINYAQDLYSTLPAWTSNEPETITEEAETTESSETARSPTPPPTNTNEGSSKTESSEKSQPPHVQPIEKGSNAQRNRAIAATALALAAITLFWFGSAGYFGGMPMPTTVMRILVAGGTVSTLASGILTFAYVRHKQSNNIKPTSQGE